VAHYCAYLFSLLGLILTNNIETGCDCNFLAYRLLFTRLNHYLLNLVQFQLSTRKQNYLFWRTNLIGRAGFTSWAYFWKRTFFGRSCAKQKTFSFTVCFVFETWKERVPLGSQFVRFHSENPLILFLLLLISWRFTQAKNHFKNVFSQIQFLDLRYKKCCFGILQIYLRIMAARLTDVAQLWVVENK